MSHMISEYFHSDLKPFHCDIVDLENLPNELPIFDDNRPKYSVFVKFLKKLGYVYDSESEKFFYLDKTTGLFFECKDQKIKNAIFYYWTKKTDGNFNLRYSDIISIVEQFKSESRTDLLDRDFSDFLGTELGSEYETSYYASIEDRLLNRPSKHHIITFRNGIFNTESQKMLPHSGLHFDPHPHDHDFTLMSKEELHDSSIKDDYLSIFSDTDTLTYYLYWVGQLIFDDHPLPCFLNFVGGGSTGKSLVSSILCDILGSKRATSVKLNDLLDKHGFSVVENRSLLVCNESESSKTATALIKELIGQNYLTINPKNKPLRTIENKIRLIICGNKYLDIDSTDSGIKRRIRVLRFNKYLDIGLGNYLYEKLSSLEGKNWLISCAFYLWVSNWYNSEENMQSLSMKNEFNSMISFDPLNDWLLSYCGSLDKVEIGKKLHKKNRRTVYDDYCAHCYSLDDKPIKMPQWNKKMHIDYDLDHKNTSGFTYLSYRYF